MKTMQRWLGLCVLGMFFFMVVVDGSIVTIAVPTMARALHVGTASVNLVISVYLITISALLLPFGQLGDRIGRTRLFQMGTAGFVIGSWLAGATNELSVVLIGRVIQAIGASMTMATSYAVVTDLFPPEQLGRAFGIESIFISLGALAGPGLGGLILANWGWREIFWVNVPIGVVCLVLSVWTLPKNVSHLQNARFDWLGVGGLILLAGGFYAVSVLAGRQPVIALAGLAVIGLILWGWLHLEKRQSAPLFEASLLKGEKVATPLLASFLSFIAAYAFVLLSPIYLQLVVHLDSRITGLVLMAGPLAALVANPLAGVLVDHWGQATLMRIGMVIMLIAQLGLIALSGVGEPWWVIIWSVISVIGTALFTTAANTQIMTGVTAAHRGAIGALNSLAREVGMMLGVSVASGIYYGVLSQTAGKMVTNALHQSRAELILAQRGAYLVASILLGVALWQLRRRIK